MGDHMDETKAIREALEYLDDVTSGGDQPEELMAARKALDALEARLKAADEKAAADTYACCGVLMWSGIWPKGVASLKPSKHVVAILERLEKAEAQIESLGDGMRLEAATTDAEREARGKAERERDEWKARAEQATRERSEARQENSELREHADALMRQRDAAWNEALEAVLIEVRRFGIGDFWLERIRSLKR